MKRYAAVFSEQARASRRFLDGARVVVEAMLQSPNFLFHVEAGPDGDPPTTTSRAGSPICCGTRCRTRRCSRRRRTASSPRPLGASASPGACSRSAEEPRSARPVFRRVAAVRSRRQRGEVEIGIRTFTPELARGDGRGDAHATASSGLRTIATSWKRSRRTTAFLRRSWPRSTACRRRREQFEMVKFPADSQRAGILGQGTFLASTAGPTETSPTARGIFIRERLLCQHVPPPPPGVITTLPDPLADRQPQGTPAVDGGARREPDVRVLPPVDGPDRLRVRAFRRDRAVARAGTDSGAPARRWWRRRPGWSASRFPCRSTRKGRSPGFRTRPSPAPSSSGRFWPKAPCARNVSSGRCSDTPTAGWKRDADEKTIDQMSDAVQGIGLQVQETAGRTGRNRPNSCENGIA